MSSVLRVLRSFHVGFILYGVLCYRAGGAGVCVTQVICRLFTARRYATLLKKRTPCCRPVYVRLSCSCIVSRGLNAEDIVKLLSWSGSPVILVFWFRLPIPNSNGNSLSGGARYTGVGKFCDFRLKSLFISEMIWDIFPWLPWNVKDHRQRFPRFVIRRYLEKSIQKKLFLPFTIITYKDYFQEKTIINSISENLLSQFIYGRDVMRWAASAGKRKNEMFLLPQLLLLQPNATQ